MDGLGPVRRRCVWNGRCRGHAVRGGQAEQGAQAERERQLAELKAARQSALLVQSGGRTEAAASPVSESIEPAAATDGGKLALDPERDNGQQRKSDFIARSAKEDSLNPHVLMRPVSPYMLTAGTVIAGSLITGIRSDLPGMATAQVTENVFDPSNPERRTSISTIVSPIRPRTISTSSDFSMSPGAATSG